MKRLIFCLLVAYASIAPGILNAQYEWRLRACLPGPGRRNIGEFSVGNKGYVVGGWEDTQGRVVNEVWEYDPSTNIWTQKGNYPYAGDGITAFVINDTAYVGFGYDQSSVLYNNFYRYDATGDQWIPLANFLGGDRYLAMSFVIGNKGYVGCGWGNGQNNDFYEYDPGTNTWTSKASFPGAAREAGMGIAVGNQGIMGMGYNGSCLSDMYIYTPSTDSWAPISTYNNTGRNGPAFFSINDTVYAGAGTDGNISYADCWRYDVPGNTWIQEPSFSCMGAGRMSAMGGWTINGHGYIPLGGVIGASDFNNLLEFGPPDGAFDSPVHLLGNDTSYCGNFSRTLSTGNSCTVWSTGVVASQITVSTPGTYWAYFAGNCGMESDTINITGGPGNTTFLGSDTTYCGSFSRVLSSGNSNTTWSTGATGAQITVTSPGIYWATSNSTCGVVSDTIQIAQSTSPTVNLGNDTTICASQTLVLSAGNAGSTYTWNTGVHTQTISVSASGTYSVTVTNTSGCSMADNIVISTYQLHDSITKLNASCSLNNGYIQVNLNNGNPPYRYVWSNSDTTSSIAGLAAGNYNVTVTDRAGCTATSNATIISTGTPTVQIAAPQTTVCPGDTAQICATPGFAYYEWNTGDTAACIQTVYAGNYYVTAYEAANCSATSNQLTITVRSPQPVTVSVVSDTLTCYQALSYQWYLNGVALPGDTFPVLIAPQSGTYLVKVLDANGCYDNSSPITVTAIDEIEGDASITLYPNPTGGNAVVKFNGAMNASTYQLIASDARIVQHGLITGDDFTFSTDRMADGIYLLKIMDKTGNLATKRFMVLRAK